LQQSASTKYIECITILFTIVELDSLNCGRKNRGDCIIVSINSLILVCLLILTDLRMRICVGLAMKMKKIIFLVIVLSKAGIM